MISFTQETNSATAAVIGMYLFTIPYSIGEGPVPFVSYLALDLRSNSNFLLGLRR